MFASCSIQAFLEQLPVSYSFVSAGKGNTRYVDRAPTLLRAACAKVARTTPDQLSLIEVPEVFRYRGFLTANEMNKIKSLSYESILIPVF